MSAQLKQQIEQPAQEHELRFCPRCDAMRPVSEFGISRSRPDGLNRYCKTHARELVYDFRRRHQGYKATQFQRKQARDKAAAKHATKKPRRAEPPVAAEDLVLAELRQGERTQKQLHETTKLSMAHVEIILTRLRIERRLIGSRALSDDERIFFLL